MELFLVTYDCFFYCFAKNIANRGDLKVSTLSKKHRRRMFYSGVGTKKHQGDTSYIREGT